MSATTEHPHTRTPTYAELVNDQTPWTMADIAVHLNVQPQTVRSWRKDALKSESATPTTIPHPNHLPKPDIPVTGKPTWKAGTVRRWAIQTWRMSPEGLPLRAKPPGRPRAPRAQKAA